MDCPGVQDVPLVQTWSVQVDPFGGDVDCEMGGQGLYDGK